eukprot:7569856-Alexandrium_andersonii.AAC.1
MSNLVGMTQAIPVTGPWGRDWPRIVYHGTSSMVAQSIVQKGLGRELAWGGQGTDRTHYHFAETLLESADQAGIRGGSGAVVVVDLGRLRRAGAQ